VNQVSLFKFKNGTEHWLQMTTVPVRSSEGFIVGSVSVARDISDLKKTESELREAIIEAKAASRAKGEFLAAMSHEIRTPINGIIGASELCQETRLDPEQRDYLDTVTQCSSTLMSLINDVLDFSKIEAGQLNLEKLNFCPRSLLEDIAEEFSPTTRKKGVELVVGYDESLPHFVMGDPTRIKQILYNLIGNAVKFTEVGEIKMKADLLECDESSAFIRFSVADTGIGIDASRCEAIFSSFTQADMSTTRKYGGTGLGLSICKELTELMDGNIHVQSVLGEGSKFWIDVPFARSERNGAEAIPFNPELAGLRVLVVDDNLTNRDIYQQMCAGWGYRSSGAKDSLEALALLEQAVSENDPYLLILLDQQMPGLSGLDLAGLVRSRPEMSESRIILLSSALGRDEAERAKRIGICRALSKPVRRTTLLEVILETFEVDGPEARKEPVISDEELTTGGLNILLAEDNEINQKIASRRLEKLGHTVTVAENGLRVLELLKREVFDCILMDIQMPEMDGYQTTRRIRILESKEGRSPIHIIAMTAHAMKGDRERCLKSGMNNYISKPFKAEHLKEVLEAIDNRGIRELETFTVEHEEHAGSFSERISELDSQDVEDLMAVAEIFIRTLPDEIARFERALKSRDYQQIYFVAHSLKGVTGVFMCDRSVELAGNIELACDRQNLERIDELAEQLLQQLHVLAAEIEEELQPQV
jgi:two-component system, sensor histidine kinase and response regulator